MRQSILFALLFTTTYCFAGKTDSIFQRHQISFSVTNAMSQEFFNGPKGATAREVLNNWFYSNTLYEPNYAVHVRLDYSVALSKILRLETGIGYLIEGETQSTSFSGEITFGSYTEYYYSGSLTVPVHLKFSKPLHRGAFTCTIGPDFNFPVHYFFKQVNNQGYGNNIPDFEYHRLYNTAMTTSLSSLGFDLKMGYEKKLTKNSLIDFGPIINFSDLVYFDKETNQEFRSERYRPYHCYLGLDVAFIFDAKKKN